MKNIFFTAAMVVLFIIAGCTKGGVPEGVSGNTYAVSAALDGQKVVPSTINDTTKGSLVGWFDDEANGLSFTLTFKKDTTVFKKDTIVAISLYKDRPAASGVAATRNFPFLLNIDASSKANISASLTFGLAGNNQFTAEEKSAFLAGKWYLQVISKRFPNGVIGGQLNIVKQ